LGEETDVCAFLSMSLLILKTHPKSIFSPEMLYLMKGHMQFPVMRGHRIQREGKKHSALTSTACRACTGTMVELV